MTCSPEGMISHYDKNGVLVWTGSTLHGLLDGDSIWYYPSGAILKKSSYKAGKPCGKSQRFFPNGVLAEEQHFLLGVLDGISITYYPQGNQQSVRLFKNGHVHGLMELYYPSGQQRRQTFYTEGSRDGIDIAWDFFGSVLFYEEWSQGRKIRDVVPDSLMKLYMHKQTLA